MKPDNSPLRTALVGFAIFTISMGIGRFAFTPILPVMQTEGLLSISGAGALASVHFIGYAMGALLAGRLSSSPRTTLFTSLVVIGLATILMGLSSSYSIWIFARWIVGVCSALVLVVVSTYFVKHLADVGRADLQGWVFAGVGGGTALVGLVMLMFMATGAPSQLSWQVFGFATLAATAAIFMLLGARSFVSASTNCLDARAYQTLPWQLILPYGAMGAGYIIPATYLPIMAQQAVSSPMTFGWSWPIFGFAAVVSTLFTARLHHTFSNQNIWIASQLIMAFGLLVASFWPNIIGVAISGLCVGGTFMVITMAGMKEAHRIAESGHAQHLIAAMTASFAFGQIVGPFLAGWAYDATNSFAYPLLMGSVMLVMTLAPMIKSSVIAKCSM